MAPEILFGYAPSPTSDVWAHAWVLYEIIGVAGTSFANVSQTLLALGALPQKLRRHRGSAGGDKVTPLSGGWLDDDKWFDSSRAPKQPLDLLVTQQLPTLKQRKRAALLDMLRGALVYETAKRVSAAALAAHPSVDPAQWWFPEELDGETDYTLGSS